MRPGFKKTALGWIPEEWDVKKIGDLQPFVTSGSRGWANYYSDYGSLFVRITNLTRTSINLDLEDMRFVNLPGIGSEGVRTQLRDGDVLISITADIGIIGFITSDIPKPAYINQHISLIRFNQEKINTQFVSYFLASEKTQKHFRSLTDSGAKAGMNLSTVQQIHLALPPIPEQIKIAQILSTWDKTITQTQQLIEAKQYYFNWLIEKLINPKDKSNWHFVKLDQLICESRIPGKTGADAKKLTVKLYGKGVIPKSENRTGSENTKFFIRKSGQFIYSKLDFLNGAFGIIPPELDGYESTLDLPSFDISPNVSGDWLLYFFNRPLFYTSQQNLAKGQRKARRINPNDLLALEIQLPNKEEQLKTVATLNACKSEIGLLNRKIDFLQTQKQGLMQKMLTGQIRVKVEA